MDKQQFYTEKDLKEIEKFLKDSYIEIINTCPGAKAKDSTTVAQPEIDRLRRKVKTPPKATITDEDIDDFVDAMKSPFANDFGNIKKDVLRNFESRHPCSTIIDAGNKDRGLGIIFLINLAKQLCKDASKTKPIKTAITSACLAGMMQTIGIPLVFAPLVIWLMTKARDIGLPALCKSLDEYISSKGI